MRTFGCCCEKSAVQRVMTGLIKVLPAPNRLTFSFVPEDLQAVNAPITATAASAAVNFLVMDTLHKRIFFRDCIQAEMYMRNVTFQRILPSVVLPQKWQRRASTAVLSL